MVQSLNFIDLFAGTGGLSEGFIRARYTPLAHIERHKYACNKPKTRGAFHCLKSFDQIVPTKVFSKHEWYCEQIERFKMGIDEFKNIVV